MEKIAINFMQLKGMAKRSPAAAGAIAGAVGGGVAGAAGADEGHSVRGAIKGAVGGAALGAIGGAGWKANKLMRVSGAKSLVADGKALGVDPKTTANIATQAMSTTAQRASKGLLMKKADVIMEKIGEQEKEYLGSRALVAGANAVTFGTSGWLRNRALQGKKNVGNKGMGASEKAVISKIKKDDTGSHVIARTMTSPVVQGSAAAASGALAGHLLAEKAPKGKRALIAAAAGLGYGAYAAVANHGFNAAHARALTGRANAGKTGVGAKEQQLIKQIKDSK